MNQDKKLHICKCGKPHLVDSIELFTLSDKFKYINCVCGVSQVNPFMLHTYNNNYIEVKYIQYAPYLTEINIDLDRIELLPQFNPINVFPHIESLYSVGDRYVLEDVFEALNIIEFEKDYKQNDTFLYEIRQDNLHLGVIGLEVHFNKKTKLNTYWLSWTIVVDSFRSGGIGKVALDKLCGILKEKGVDTLYVDSDENPQTIKFYEKNNFEIISTAKEFRTNTPGVNKYFLMYDVDIIMKREI